MFLEIPSLDQEKQKSNMLVDEGSTSTCKLVLVESKGISTTQRIDMENTKWPG